LQTNHVGIDLGRVHTVVVAIHYHFVANHVQSGIAIGIHTAIIMAYCVNSGAREAEGNFVASKLGYDIAKHPRFTFTNITIRSKILEGYTALVVYYGIPPGESSIRNTQAGFNYYFIAHHLGSYRTIAIRAAYRHANEISSGFAINMYRIIAIS